MSRRTAALRLARDGDFRRATARKVAQRGRASVRGSAGARIGTGVRLTGPGEYLLRRGSLIHDRVQAFVADGAVLELAPRSAIGARSVVNVATRVTIGAGTQVSWQCQILDTDFHEIRDEDGRAGPVSAPVTIGEHVLIGTGAIILKGVTIGDHAVVGAGSVVSGDVPAYAIVAGNPARVVGRTSGWS
ncbi:acyltransferase [Luteipulveratus sp. YIM 133132]|uniref:acyltransferase n=1 Tax=Luteipulveratus flavus TaxID=3031728 RepID=UPI0023AEB2C4|nr:acyltransferase [Luteipulveratus sp. YIM 133132]MDE9364328.1 acyltransferase [Luteipulveratus sp. YIM 133132]